MKKAFTLIELLVVIAVLAILMGLVFRLSATGGESHRRTETVARLQRIENCLSGYNAAFGSYPPVKLHGLRDIYRRTDGRGIQSSARNEGLWSWDPQRFRRGVYQQAERDAWRQVEAACRSQPVACRYPFPEEYGTLIDTVSREMKRRAESGEDQYKSYWNDDYTRSKLTSGFDGLTRNQNRLSSAKGKTDWRDIQLFKFGLMSFLLPRYLVMMNGYDGFYNGQYAQWTGNNTMPSNPLTGRRYSNWREVWDLSRSTQRSDLAKIANIPSQAVCARWMPNLRDTCAANHAYTLFGVDIRDGSQHGELGVDRPGIEVFSPGDADSGGANFREAYILDGVTVRDGWGNDLYYYSPYPHQKYVLWSSGANGRTFPPWISKSRLGSKANECVAAWTEDDIVQLSN